MSIIPNNTGSMPNTTCVVKFLFDLTHDDNLFCPSKSLPSVENLIVSPVRPHLLTLISAENCWTLFGLGGLLPLFRIDEIFSAVIGSISTITLVLGGEAIFCSMIDNAVGMTGWVIFSLPCTQISRVRYKKMYINRVYIFCMIRVNGSEAASNWMRFLNVQFSCDFPCPTKKAAPREAAFQFMTISASLSRRGIRRLRPWLRRPAWLPGLRRSADRRRASTGAPCRDRRSPSASP